MNDYQAIREECAESNRALGRTGLVDLTFGNVSVADPDQRVFAIKPSGVAYADLTPDQIVVLDYEGKQLHGDLRPSSDTPTHRCLLLSLPDIRSVVHTHSRCAVAFAQAGMELPCLGTTHADYFLGPIPVTREMTRHEVDDEYEWNTGRVIIETFARKHARPLRDASTPDTAPLAWQISPTEIPAVLVRNHGPFVWGSSSIKALETALALEIVADLALKTLGIAPQAEPAAEHLTDKHFLRKQGPDAYYGQSERQSHPSRRSETETE